MSVGFAPVSHTSEQSRPAQCSVTLCHLPQGGSFEIKTSRHLARSTLQLQHDTGCWRHLGALRERLSTPKHSLLVGHSQDPAQQLEHHMRLAEADHQRCFLRASEEKHSSAAPAALCHSGIQQCSWGQGCRVPGPRVLTPQGGWEHPAQKSLSQHWDIRSLPFHGTFKSLKGFPTARAHLPQ